FPEWDGASYGSTYRPRFRAGGRKIDELWATPEGVRATVSSGRVCCSLRVLCDLCGKGLRIFNRKDAKELRRDREGQGLPWQDLRALAGKRDTMTDRQVIDAFGRSRPPA